MRREFFTPKDRMFAAVAELQEALDPWVTEYNTARPHESCGGRSPVERFRLANRSLTADDSAVAEPPPARPPALAAKRPAGVSRWVNAAGKISLAGFTYSAGATYAGEPVEGRGGRWPGRHPARRRGGRHPRPAAAARPGPAGHPGPGSPGTPPPG